MEAAEDTAAVSTKENPQCGNPDGHATNVSGDGSAASARPEEINSSKCEAHTDSKTAYSQKQNSHKPDLQIPYDSHDTTELASTISNTPSSVSEKAPLAENQECELKIPQEHARLDSLLGQIPKKAQQGLLMQCDLVLTCIDADSNYIALGTNIGLTFLYNRKDQSMQRLKSETSSDVITCVKLHHGMDHQLATGMASGTLCIFLIPGYTSLHKKQLQKFEVKTVHRHYISCVEWSTNGMKLFSGDKTGHVVCTEVDFYQGLCKSAELLVEPPTEIVQLHYDHKVLLVSTKTRSFVCRLDTSCEVVHIGQKDRKVQGNFGACFIPRLCKTDDAKLYAVRPGCRVWLSDVKGVVCNTHIFKDELMSGVREIPLLRPGRNTSTNTDLQFGRLHMYREKQLVTYNQSSLFILDPALNKVVTAVNRLGGIVDVAVLGGEIFVLRRHTEDAVIRIAEKPEPVNHTAALRDLPGTEPSSARSAPPVSPPATLAVQKPDQNARPSSPKSFFKKTILTPFKKLDSLLHEHGARQTKESDSKYVTAGGSDRGGGVSDSKMTNVTAASVSKVTDVTASVGKTSSVTAKPVTMDTSPDLPPVVALNSPDLAVRVFTGGPTPISPTDVSSPDSAHSALSAFADEISDSHPGGVKIQVTSAGGSETSSKAGHEHLGPIADRIHFAAPELAANDDIVFSQQVGRKKQKKKKLKGKEGDREEDSISQSLYGSHMSTEDTRPEDTRDEQREKLFSGDTDEVSEVLRRAEEALSSFNKIVKGGSGDLSQEKESTSTTKRETQTNSESSDSKTGSPGTVTAENSSAVQMAMGREKQMVKPPSAPVIQSSVELAKAPEKQPAKGDVSKPAVPSSLDQRKSDIVKEQALTLVMPSSVGQRKSPEEQAKPVLSSFENVLEGADPLAAAEETLYKMTKGRSARPSHQDSVDDFYSRFSDPYSPVDLLESPVFPPRDSSPVSKPQNPAPEADRQNSQVSTTSSGGSDSERSLPEVTLRRLANSWSEFTTPANIYSLALSETHIWFTDKSENLYYSALGGVKGILWRKVGEPASQISVSPSGHIVWRLHRGRVFAGTKITHRHPEGLKWVEAVRDVSHVSADDHCAWYVKTNGEVMMQRGLSKERPCYRSISVPCTARVKKVIAQHGVVWAITESLKLLVRKDITNETPQGTEWLEMNRQLEPFLFSSCSIDSEGYGWAVDVLGQIWFTDHVTPSTPAGSGHWWQVPLSEYYVQDPTMLDMIRSIAKKFDPQKLSYVLSTSRGGLIVARGQGVWLAMDYQNMLHVCRASLQGYHWSPAQPTQMAESTTWKQVQVSIADLDWGFVWAQQVNSELYVIPTDSSNATLVPSPLFVSLAVNEHSVWGLTDSGEVHVRTGMGQHCPIGAAWTQLDLAQLGDVFLVYLSCNNSYVWAVDSDGQVFNRIGANAPRPGQLNPVWLPIDTYSEIVFTKVVNGPADWMVWAVDNRRLTYVRVGITEEMPIGREWVHVPGIQAMDLTLSATGVWAINTNGEIFFRYGISESNVSGNYWKKIPGSFLKISASASDILWAINTSGQLVKCSTRYISRRQDLADSLLQRGVSSTGSDEGDWELV